MMREFPQIVQRMADYFNANGIGPREAAKDLGCTPSAISEIISGKTRDPRVSLVAKFCQRYFISADHILLGRGSLRTSDDNEAEQEEEPAETSGAKDESLEEDVQRERETSDMDWLLYNEMIDMLKMQVEFLQEQVAAQTRIIEKLTNGKE